MKLTKIALGVAAALVAPSVFALTPAQLNALEPGGVTKLWISGATAPTASIYKSARKACSLDANGNPTDLHVYTEVAGGTEPGVTGGKFYAYACTMTNTGLPTILYHTGDVGSFEAYTPHLFMLDGLSTYVPTSVKRLKDIQVVGVSNTCAASGVVPGTAGPGGYLGDPVFTGCGNVSVPLATNTNSTTLPTLPQGGFSDTEYTLNQLNLNIARSLDEIGSEAATNVGQGFGLAVSHKLYFDLQQEQFGAANSCVLGKTVATLDKSETCRPNVSAHQYASLVSLASVTNKDNTIFKKSTGPSTIFTGTAPVNVQRRVGTSGTQSSSNAYFLNKPCSSGTPAGQLALAGPDPQLPGTTIYNGGKIVVTNNDGSSNVRTALNTAGVGSYAIGVLSLENNPAAANLWAWVKLDSVSPTIDGNNPGLNRQTAIDGDYKFWYELVAFTATSAFPEGQQAIADIVTGWADPAITKLRGIFPTAGTGVVNNTDVARGYKSGNACAPAING